MIGKIVQILMYNGFSAIGRVKVWQFKDGFIILESMDKSEEIVITKTSDIFCYKIKLEKEFEPVIQSTLTSNVKTNHIDRISDLYEKYKTSKKNEAQQIKDILNNRKIIKNG